MSIFEVNSLFWSSVPEAMRKSLLKLTLSARTGSEIRNVLDSADKLKTFDPEIFYLKDEKNYLAWAVITYDHYHWARNYSKDPHIMIFVDSEHRRCGIGSKLLSIVKTKYPQIRCTPWSSASQQFFGRFNLQTYWGGEAKLMSFQRSNGEA